MSDDVMEGVHRYKHPDEIPTDGSVAAAMLLVDPLEMSPMHVAQRIEEYASHFAGSARPMLMLKLVTGAPVGCTMQRIWAFCFVTLCEAALRHLAACPVAPPVEADPQPGHMVGRRALIALAGHGEIVPCGDGEYDVKLSPEGEMIEMRITSTTCKGGQA